MLWGIRHIQVYLRRFYRSVRDLREFVGYYPFRHEFQNFRKQQELMASNERNVIGFVNDEELFLLSELVRESNAYPGPIIEIGTLFGFSTLQMCLWKHPGKLVITVDNYSWNPWFLSPEAHFGLTRRILRHLIIASEVELIRMDKAEFYRSYAGENPALVFLDAVHTYEETIADIKWARQVGAKIISGHDYSSEFPGVQRAVDESGGPKRLRGTLWSLS